MKMIPIWTTHLFDCPKTERSIRQEPCASPDLESQGKSSLNSVRVHSYSESRGFVLSDALISLAAVGVLALLVQSSVQSLAHWNEKKNEVFQKSEEQYEEMLGGIGECVCEEPPLEEEQEETGEEADTSWNSY